MSSSILHSCPFCGHVTDISEILAEFVGNPHCTQCGLSASEGNLKAQDDLVSLFNTHMNMGPSTALAKEIRPPPITYSITQHYHHSAHVAQKPADSGAMQENVLSGTNEAANRVFEMLSQHNVDASSLSPNQLELFANAIPEQQSRLIQMWQICPEPRKSAQSFTELPRTAPATDLEMYDSEESNKGANADQFAEPYMLSGYGLVARDSEVHPVARPANEPTTGSPYRLSSDPIYQAGGQRWWERTQAVAMEY
ncbi:hypothetical protein BDV12DRAFT_168915 [Aspergillus spectabilis]